MPARRCNSSWIVWHCGSATDSEGPPRARGMWRSVPI